MTCSFKSASRRPCKRPTFKSGKYLFLSSLYILIGFQFRLFVFFDNRIDDISLMPRRDLLAHKLPNFVRPIVGPGASRLACVPAAFRRER